MSSQSSPLTGCHWIQKIRETLVVVHAEHMVEVWDMRRDKKKLLSHIGSSHPAQYYSCTRWGCNDWFGEKEKLGWTFPGGGADKNNDGVYFSIQSLRFFLHFNTNVGQHSEIQVLFNLLPSYRNHPWAQPSGTPGYLKAIVFQELLASSLLPGNLLQTGVSVNALVTAVPRWSRKKQRVDADAGTYGQNGVDSIHLNWEPKPALLQQSR